MSLDSRDDRAETLTRRRLTAYGVGSVGTAVFATVPGLLLLYYLTDILGVAAGIAGLVVVLPKLWDVVFNPIVGAASDREAVRTGRRTGLMLRGAVALPILFAVMFMSPFTGGGGALWVAAIFVLAASAYALFQVPYVGLPAEMAADPAARTAITARRVIYLTIGILLGGGLAPALAAAAGGGRAGYLLMGAVVGVLMLGALLSAALGSRWVPATPGRPLGLIAAVRSTRGNRAFFALLTVYITQAIAVAAMLAAAPYIATYWLGSHGLTSILFVCLVAPTALAVPVWEKLAQRFGRLRCLTIATVGYAVGTALSLPGIALGGRGPALALIAFLGICYAALQLLPLALLPDTVLADADRTGQAQPGTFTGLWTAGETAGMALGPGLFSVALAVSGYAPTTWDAPLAQADNARLGILLGFTVAPALLMLASLPALRTFARRRTTAPSAAPLDSDSDLNPA